MELSPLYNEDDPAGGPQDGEGPPDDLLGTVSGYESMTSNLIAPPILQQTEEVTPSAPPPPTFAHINEDQARSAVLRLARSNFCWGKKAAEEMDINSVTSSSAYHYALNTFTEARKTNWAFVAYHGGPIDGPMNGPAPSPWEIPISHNALFQDHEKTCEVPHTANVKVCRFCHGQGSKMCMRCNGRGINKCNSCNGRGNIRRPATADHPAHDERCHNCHGRGDIRCSSCGGDGRINCGPCGAGGKLKWFIKLTVIWKVHSADHIVEVTALPDHLIRGASGQIAFEDSRPRVFPVNHFPNSEINRASLSLVQQHATGFPNERILMQRHQVRVVPVSEVEANYKDKRFSFWVYGTDNNAFAPDYPQQCCCGCTLL